MIDEDLMFEIIEDNEILEKRGITKEDFEAYVKQFQEM